MLPLRVAVLPLALCAAFGAFAQSGSLTETVVTATRVATRADELVSDVKVVDRAAIEASTARTLPELLARTAGVQMSSNGGRGKQSNIFIRGAENRHTILLVDGVRLGSATAGTPSWDTIPVEMIERIEILKGPASALYGSEGVGGVVQIFTRKGRDGLHPNASLTAGSDRHWVAGAGMQGGQGALKYSVGVQRARERGFSSTNPAVPFGNFNGDLDPFRQDALTASASYDFSPQWSVDAGLMHSDGISWFDDGPGVDSRTAIRALTAHAGVRGRFMPGWQTELRFSQGTDTANIIEAASPGAFKTKQSQWTWQNNLETPLGVVLAGLERREQDISATAAYAVTHRSIDGVFAGLNGSAGPHSWQFNLRRDRNSQFGGETTGFAGYGFRITPAWRVHASHGTTFVAPSFNQLYFPRFGNPLLLPERGKNTDVGVTWTQGAHELKLVRFDNRIRGFMTNTTLPINIPQARIDGWTLGYEGRIDALALRANFERLDPRNEANGRQLPRRAKQQLNLGADYRLGDWRFGCALLHAGDRFDDAANTRPLGAYTTLDVHLDRQLTPAWSVQAKVNNLTDKQYETATGYNQAGRAVFVTLRWQPK
ncbi:TonB-dependent receptor domain-containing protein [Caenimonas sedimenti]|uniref:TonB-dependent receptor domain-containing protein n=1 Tax=Caenimonas sedimenti TaxID=2596921 RepID=UPI002546487D|nr:TonB-dependent receptor [Caenimonas sedimenti]